MELFFILIGGILGITLGRILMKRWYNHLTIYSFLWTICLISYTLRYIQYYQLLPEAWCYIGISWFMIFLGSWTVIFARLTGNKSIEHPGVNNKSNAHLLVNLKILSRAIIILSLLSLLAIIYTSASVIRTFGSIVAAIIHSEVLYRLRIIGELMSIPYLGSFALVGSCLAGIYTALRQKVTFLSILPLLLEVVYGIVAMGRTDIVIAGTLFVTAFFYTPHKHFNYFKTVVMAILISILILGSFTFISSTRKLVVHFQHETKEMENLRSTISFLPSIYFYLSGPPVAFSEYLYLNKETVPWGSYTFKPFYNILAKFGFVEYPPRYQPFIKTPESINTGTYLREIHADFGPVGVIIFPYVLGAILTALYGYVSRRPTFLGILILAYFNAVVWMSWDFNIMQLGQWTVSLLVGLLIAIKLDSLARKALILKDS